MSKRKLKKFTAMALATVMTLGSSFMILAEEAANTNSGNAEGNGTYEGGEIKYPTISVELPTVPAGAFDYIADPNGLIEATKESDGSAAAHSGFTFTGSTGIFFKTTASTYTEKSEAMKITNKSAQKVDVTVKLSQKTAGSNIIQYADTPTFTDATDKTNKIYLAVTDGADANPKTAALSATGEKTIKVEVEGVENNFEKKWDAAKGYHYAEKSSVDPSTWKSTSFYMTGALNPNATWGDEVTFPTITLTWNVVEHRDSALSASSVSATANTLTVTDATVSKVTLVQTSGTRIVAKAGTHYTFANGTLTLQAEMLGGNVGGTLEIELSTGNTETVSIQ